MSLDKELCKRCFVEHGLSNRESRRQTGRTFRKAFRRFLKKGIIWCNVKNRFLVIEENEAPRECPYILEQVIQC